MTSWIENPTSLPTWEAIVDAVTKYMDASDMDANVRQLFVDVALRIGDTGWTTLTVSNSGFRAGAVATAWRQVGSLVTVVGTLSRTTSNDLVPDAVNWTSNVFAVLPASARPAVLWQEPQMTASLAGARMELKVGTDGGISYRNTGSANMPAGANFGCYATFLAG